MRKKKMIIYFIALFLIIILGVIVSEKSGNSYSLVNNVNSVSLVDEKMYNGYKSVDYDITVNNKKHRIAFKVSINEYGEKEFVLSFDGKNVKVVSVDNDFDVFKNYDSYTLSSKDFYFIKGADSKMYLGIRFVHLLMLFNEDGKVLTHKPFEEEIDYFNFVFDGNIFILDSILNFDDENQKDVKSKYFYKDTRFTCNDGYVATKIENNKIYSFNVAPGDLSFLDYYPNYVYLYENEYVINNDEIYYKELNKYKVYIHHEW